MHHDLHMADSCTVMFTRSNYPLFSTEQSTSLLRIPLSWAPTVKQNPLHDFPTYTVFKLKYIVLYRNSDISKAIYTQMSIQRIITLSCHCEY